MNLLNQVKNELEEILDKGFPKGKSKARGAALVLFAFAMLKIKETIRAFGGCEKCYGKGYATQKAQYESFEDFGGEKTGVWEADPIKPCSCDRGKQIEKILNKK